MNSFALTASLQNVLCPSGITTSAGGVRTFSGKTSSAMNMSSTPDGFRKAAEGLHGSGPRRGTGASFRQGESSRKESSYFLPSGKILVKGKRKEEVLEEKYLYLQRENENV